MVEFYEGEDGGEVYGGDTENIPDDWGYDPNYDWQPTNEEYEGPITTTWDQNWNPVSESQPSPLTRLTDSVGVGRGYGDFVSSPTKTKTPMPTYSGSRAGDQGLYRGNIENAYQTQARTSQANLNEQMRQFNEQANAQRTSAIQAGGGLVNLVNEYNRSYAQARYDYEQRYNQMLGIADSTTSQQQADLRAQYSGQRAAGMQRLQRLGMANTSLTSSMQQGLQRGESDALNRLADTMQQTKLGIIGSKKTAQELAPSRDTILAAIAQGQAASGPYGGELTQAIGGIDFGTAPGQLVQAKTPIGPPLNTIQTNPAVQL